MLTPLQAYKQLCQLEKTLPQTSSIDCKFSPHHDDTSEGKPETVQELAEYSRNSPTTSENMSCGSREASPRTPPAAEPRTPPAVDPGESKCWGSLFDHECRGTGGNGEKLIDKFCSVCRTNGLLVAVKRVRVLLPEHYGRFANSRKEGFWTEGSGATPRFRVVNQTKECTGAWLVLFEKEPVGVPVDWVPPMPPDWHESTDYIRLWLSKGTMMPRQPRQKLKRKSCSDATPFPPPVLEAAPSTPVLACRVLPQPQPQPQPQPNLLDELLLGDAGAQEVDADFVRQYRAVHDALRVLIEARLARAELPLVDEQREALAEQLRLSSTSQLVFGWHRDQDRSRDALSDRETENVVGESTS